MKEKIKRQPLMLQKTSSSPAKHIFFFTGSRSNHVSFGLKRLPKSFHRQKPSSYSSIDLKNASNLIGEREKKIIIRIR